MKLSWAAFSSGVGACGRGSRRSATSRVPDEVYDTARNYFNDKELVDLTYAVALMNAYNRMAVSFRQGPEGQPPAPAAS